MKLRRFAGGARRIASGPQCLEPTGCASSRAGSAAGAVRGSTMLEMFDKIGLGQWFRYLTGGMEVTGAILLLIPATVTLGGALLVVTMAGAIATHLFVLGGSPAPAIILFVMVATVTWYR